MQTILGANGQIGLKLAQELKRNYTSEIRLVGRNPQKINPTDNLYKADLNHLESAIQAIEGSEITYFTVGLPMDSNLWEKQFIKILENVITACKVTQSKLVFFDNTYMYPQDDRVLSEDTPFMPVGRKGRVRTNMADMVLNEIVIGDIQAVICRAPEFYGPGKTQSITNTLIFDRIAKHKKLIVPISDNKLRSLIWTPDASRATALIGNTPEAFGQTWHLPVDDETLTYKQFIELASQVYHRKLKYNVVPKYLFDIGAWASPALKELKELLPRYANDNIFDDSKFKYNFPQFKITTHREGIESIMEEQMGKID